MSRKGGMLAKPLQIFRRYQEHRPDADLQSFRLGVRVGETLQWTYEPPKIAGNYYYNVDRNSHSPIIVKVHVVDGILKAKNDWPGSARIPVERFSGQWAGPLPPHPPVV